uniref:hypothetical protein n=1 Tax=Oceanivirga salmonicida TaxID=1769291 RepID=UPI0018D1FA9D
VFSKKIYLAGEELESTAKGLATAIETLGVEKDNTTDKSQQEKRGLLESGQIHLNAKHDGVTKEIRNGKAKTKEEREELTKKARFDAYIVLDEDNLPEEVITRNKELEARGLGKLRTFVGKDKNGKKILYTIGNLSEEEFKHDLAREYGINKYGRYVRDKNTGELKLLGATAGNIFAKNVKGTGDTEKIHLEADEVESVGEIISDKPTEGSNAWVVETSCFYIGREGKECYKWKNPNKAYRDLISDDIVKSKDFKKEFEPLGFRFDVEKYKRDKNYREAMNYSYYVEKNRLEYAKYKDLKFEDGIKVLNVKDKSRKIQKVEVLPAKYSMYHNIVEIGSDMYINNTESRNYKYTNEEGYEIVINFKERKIVKDPINRGTFNQDSGLGIYGLNHYSSDVALYNKYGTGIDDNTSKEKIMRINKCVKKYFRYFGEIEKGMLKCE